MRARITFSKTGPLKYIGHLDLHSLWERAARRAGLPLEYTHGFHPQPKINFASALPLGFTSRCEVVDLRFNQDVELKGLADRLQAAMPQGISILQADRVDELMPPLQTQVIAAEYEVTLIESPAPPSEIAMHPPTNHAIIPASGSLEQRAKEFLEMSSIPRERRGKAYDLRPLVEKLEVLSEDKISMRLTAREAATGRPEEVLAVMGIPLEDVRIERTSLIFQA